MKKLFFIFSFILLVFLPAALDFFFPRTYEDSIKESYHIPMQYSDFLVEELDSSKAPLDVLVLGSSQVTQNLNLDILQKSFEKKWHRPFHLMTATFQYVSFVDFYKYLDVFLKKRRVGLVLIQNHSDDADSVDSLFHWNLIREWRQIRNLPLSYQLDLWSGYILSGPRRLISRLSAIRPLSLPARELRSLNVIRKNRGFYPVPRDDSEYLIRSQVQDEPPELPLSAVFAERSDLAPFFVRRNFQRLEESYFLKLKELAKKHNLTVGFLAFPQKFSSDKVAVLDLSSEVPSPTPFIGVSKKDLFQNIRSEDVDYFYADESHFTPIGANLYTKTILKGIINLMDHSNVKWENPL